MNCDTASAHNLVASNTIRAAAICSAVHSPVDASNTPRCQRSPYSCFRGVLGHRQAFVWGPIKRDRNCAYHCRAHQYSNDAYLFHGRLPVRAAKEFVATGTSAKAMTISGDPAHGGSCNVASAGQDEPTVNVCFDLSRTFVVSWIT